MIAPGQVRGTYIILSQWVSDIEDPTWLVCLLSNPEWAHSLRESALKDIPVTGSILEADRIKFCRLFFDKIM